LKALIISDIHSNIYALEAIWNKERNSDIIYCAGDIVDYGPYPKEVLDWVREHQCRCVIGNHDKSVVSCFNECSSLKDMPDAEKEWKHHNAILLNEKDILFLEHLPKTLDFNLDGINYGMTHCYTIDYKEIKSVHMFDHFVKDKFHAKSNGLPARLILGHTHRLGVYYLSNRKMWMNPGSVSYRRPDDPSQDAHYLTITDGRIKLKRVGYDLGPLYREVRKLKLKNNELVVAFRFFGPR
jgi:predicted phosphodiesterase